MQDGGGPRQQLEVLAGGKRRKLLAVARGILGDADEAEDVVQDTLAAVWRRLDELPIRSMEKYVLRAVRNNALRRRARRRWGLALTDAHDVSPQEQDDPADPQIDPLTLEQAVSQLPPAQQAVIRMKYYMGLTFREIGQRLAVSMNTAASRGRYALGHLRRLLRQGQGRTGKDDS